MAAAVVSLGVAAAPAAHAAARPHAELLFPQFSTIGTVITRDPAGRLLVGGDYSAGVGYAITRLTPKGKLDRSFGSHGITRVKIGKSDFGDLTSVAVLPGGRILLNGTVGTDGSQQNGFGTLFGVARLTPKGKLDKGFQGSGSIRFTLGQGMDDGMWITPLPDGRVLAGGDSGDGGTIFACAASFDADFNQTPGFAPLCVEPKGAGGAAYFGAAAPDAGGSAVVSVGGMAAGGAGRTPLFGIGRVTSAGQADSGFGDGGFTTTDFGAPAHDGAQQGRRPLVARPGGWIVGGTTASDFGLVGFTSAGALDPSFGRGGKVELNVDGNKTRDVLTDLVPLRGGRFLAVGQTELRSARAGSKLLLAAVTADGKPVSSFGKHGRESLDAAALGVPTIAQIDGAVALPDGSVAIVGASHVDNFHGRPAYLMMVLRVKPNGRLAPFG